MKHRKAFSKEERQIEIINKATHRSGGDMRLTFTASEVANWIDLSVTQARTLLNGLINQGVMQVEEEEYPGVCKKRFMYGFTEQYIADCEDKKYRATPKPKRHIKINGLQIEIGGLQ
jgi:predicted ArsR family transcriptional regulator